MADKLPLVVYRDGERIVIGDAEIQDDGTISANITDAEMAEKMGLVDTSPLSIGEVFPGKKRNVFDKDKDS